MAGRQAEAWRTWLRYVCTTLRESTSLRVPPAWVLDLGSSWVVCAFSRFGLVDCLMIVPENRVAMAPRDKWESMNSTIIHSLLCPKSATVISDICKGQVHILHRWWRSFPWNSPCLAWSFSCDIAGMVEAQISELISAVQNVQAQLTASEAARTALQAQVDRMGRPSGERKIGMDTRNLGRPSQFNGTFSAWRDWSVVFRIYAALVHPALKGEMLRVERLPTAETNAGLLDDEQVQASSD